MSRAKRTSLIPSLHMRARNQRSRQALTAGFEAKTQQRTALRPFRLMSAAVSLRGNLRPPLGTWVPVPDGTEGPTQSAQWSGTWVENYLRVGICSVLGSRGGGARKTSQKRQEPSEVSQPARLPRTCSLADRRDSHRAQSHQLR